MLDYITNSLLWIFALYGLIEIIKTIIHTFTYTNLKSDGIYLIVAIKNQEEKVEGFIRSMLFRFIYGKEDCFKDIIIADLDSTDKTADIITRLQKDYNGIKFASWLECKDMIDNIDRN